jgi:hypothetical protein
LNATEIFLHPLTICFFKSLSSIRESLYRINRLFSLFILYTSLLLISSNTFVLSLSLLAIALSFSLLFLISISCLRWNMSSTRYMTFLTISWRYWICMLPLSIKSGFGIVTFILSTTLLFWLSTFEEVLACFFDGEMPKLLLFELEGGTCTTIIVFSCVTLVLLC